jgi:hypothetical protein
MTDDEKLQLEKEFRGISNEAWTSKIASPDDEIPQLFHYTNAAGLLGILSSGSLWATHFQFLNDTSEMQYGLDGARAVTSTLAEQGSEAKRRFLGDTEERLDHLFEHKIVPPYVFSFCRLGDLLSQWREYGGGGSGFSIAFDYGELSGLFGGPTGVLPITYSPTDQREILSATVEEYWKVLLRWEHKCDPTFRLPSAPENEGSIGDHCQSNLASLLVGCP